jgi:hypothetical protein
MPCYDSTRDDFFEKWQVVAPELQAHCDNLTAMLCEAMQAIEGSRDSSPAGIEDLSAGLQNWWTEHKALDKARERT